MPADLTKRIGSCPPLDFVSFYHFMEDKPARALTLEVSQTMLIQTFYQYLMGGLGQLLNRDLLLPLNKSGGADDYSWRVLTLPHNGEVIHSAFEYQEAENESLTFALSFETYAQKAPRIMSVNRLSVFTEKANLATMNLSNHQLLGTVDPRIADPEGLGLCQLAMFLADNIGARIREESGIDAFPQPIM
jgi:hypothetical protein